MTLTPAEAQTVAELRNYDNKQFYQGRISFLREQLLRLRQALEELSETPGNMEAHSVVVVARMLDIMLMMLLDLRMRHEALMEAMKKWPLSRSSEPSAPGPAGSPPSSG